MEQRFSDKIGITKPPALQLDAMNDALRNSLWNILVSAFGREMHECWIEAGRTLAVVFFKERADLVPNVYQYEAKDWLAARYFKLPWYEVYNLIQVLGPRMPRLTGHRASVETFETRTNEVLEREASGYRFTTGELVPITSKSELTSIEEALEASTRHGLDGVHAHLTKAVALLSQKPKPDYHNTIKEAITAVEAVANLLSGESASGLDKPLNELAKQVHIHPAMKEAFLKLYGYTSSKEGIRHPMLEESGVGFDEAKFMLVACSAFVYFLVSKAAAVGLLKK